MAQLTWRNVDNPNFGTSLAGIRTFSDLASGSANQLAQALGNFQQANQQQAGNEVLNRALQINDPAAYQRALTSGELLGNLSPNDVSPETLTALGSRQSDLIRQAGQQAVTAQNQYTFGRQVEGDARMAGADAAIREYTAAAISGDPRRLAAAQQVLSASGLRADQVADQTKVGLGIQGSALGNQNALTSGAAASYALNERMANDMATRESQDLIAQARQASVSDRQFQENLGLLMDTASPGAARILAQQLGYGQAPAGSGGGAPRASAPGTAGTRAGDSYDVTYNFTPTERPITQMPIGDVLTHQQGMINNPELKNSPVGRYQINKATLEQYGPKVLGENWKEQPLSPENQEKLAEALYNDRKSGDLTKTWAALSNSTPGAYKDVPWSEARTQIASGEVGARDAGVDIRPQAEIRNEAEIASRQVLNRASQEAVNSLSNGFDAAVLDTRSTADIMNAATNKGGAFEGADPRWIALQLERAQEYGRDLGVEVPPAVALQALAQSAGSGRTSWLGQTWDALSSSVGGGPRDNDPNTGRGVNADRVKQLIQQEYAGGRSEERVAAAETRKQLADNIQAARQAADVAAQELAAARSGAARNPRLAAGIPRLEQRLAQAQAQHDRYLGMLAENSARLAAQRAVAAAPKKTGTVSQTSPQARPLVDANAIVIDPSQLSWID